RRAVGWACDAAHDHGPAPPVACRAGPLPGTACRCGASGGRLGVLLLLHRAAVTSARSGLAVLGGNRSAVLAPAGGDLPAVGGRRLVRHGVVHREEFTP